MSSSVVGGHEKNKFDGHQMSLTVVYLYSEVLCLVGAGLVGSLYNEVQCMMGNGHMRTPLNRMTDKHL